MTRHSRHRLAVARVAALTITAFVLGLAVRGSTSQPHDRPRPLPTAIEHTLGPRTTSDGIPSGFERSGRGAVAAAAAYVLTGARLVDMKRSEVAAAVDRMSTAATASQQKRTTLDDLDRIDRELASGTGPIHYDQAVLDTHLDSYTSDRSQVRVWSVGVVARDGVLDPQAEWHISTVELEWQSNDWKIADETISSGPTPAADADGEPSTAAEIDRQLSGFDRWGKS